MEDVQRDHYKEQEPSYSDVDCVNSNAMLREKLLDLEAIRAMEAGKGHDFVDDDLVLAKVEDIGKAPFAKFTGVRPFAGVGTRVADVVA
jgi:hypothetical protein